MLAAAGIPSVVFVCPALIAGHVEWSPAYQAERLVDAEELGKLPGLGMELGIHGSDHTRLAGLDDVALHTHTVTARAELEAVTGVRARAFAYPYGTHVARTRDAVAEAGYDVAFAVAREHGRFAVDRVFVQSTDSMLRFRLKLSGGYRLVSRMAGRAWKVRHRGRAAIALIRRARSGRAERAP